MRTRGLGLIILCLTILFAAVQAGCRKKPQEPTGDLPQSDQAAQSFDAQPPAPPALDVARRLQDDRNSTADDIAAAAAQMSADDLRKMAEKYRDVIAANQQKLDTLTKEYIAIPAAETIAPEAQTLKATIDELYTDLPQIKDRFSIYYNALKEKDGNMTGLDV